MSASFPSRLGKWKQLNWDLFTVCAAIEKRVGAFADSKPIDPSLRIGLMFVSKNARTLNGVCLLYDNALEEQAQVLVRVLFELRLNFDCFRRMAAADLQSASRRVMDAMMLEKLRQQRASDFAGTPAEVRAALEEAEAKIGSRYSVSELKKLTRHGFTGMSIEERAKFTGHAEAYNIVYRNFSRNAHSTDYTEHMLDIAAEDMDEYLFSRDIVGLYTAHFSAGGIAESANLDFKCGLNTELDRIGIRQKELKST